MQKHTTSTNAVQSSTHSYGKHRNPNWIWTMLHGCRHSQQVAVVVAVAVRTMMLTCLRRKTTMWIKTWFNCKLPCTKRWGGSSPKQLPSKHGSVQCIRLLLSQPKKRKAMRMMKKKTKKEGRMGNEKTLGDDPSSVVVFDGASDLRRPLISASLLHPCEGK